MSSSVPKVEIPEQGGACTLGVHLDIDALRVVEINRGRITQWASIAYPPGMQPSAGGFSTFLKSSLAGFQSVLRHTSIWVVGPTPSLQMRFLSLPRVRPRQVSNLVYWTFRKEIPFDAAQTVFDYNVEGADPSVPGSSKKMDVTAYTVSQADINALTGLFSHAGVHVEGIIIPSFAMRNLFRGQSSGGGMATSMGLYVGEDSSAIMFFRGKHVVSHRLFKTGLNVMLDVLQDRHPDWSPGQTYHEIQAALEAEPAAGPSPDRADGGAAERVRDSVRTAFDRLIQQVERSMSAYLVGKEESIREIHVAGPMAGLAPLVKELGQRLGLESGPLDWFRTAHAMDRKAGSWPPGEAGQMAIALGAALSERSRTPNLVYTYVKRQKEASSARVKQLLVGVGVIGVALMLGASHLVQNVNGRMRRELATCVEKIHRYAPRPDRAMIQTLSDKAGADSVQMKSMARRSLPIAGMNQLALLTPEGIRLVSVVMEPGEVGKAGGVAAKKKHGTATDSAPEIRLRLEGMVFGEIGAQESELASYQLRLEGAELFENVTLVRSEGGAEGMDPVLLFTLDLQLEDLAAAPLRAPVPPGKGKAP